MQRSTWSTIGRSALLVPAALVAVAAPASAADGVTVTPKDGGVVVTADAGIALGGVHQSTTVTPTSTATSTCAGALLVGGCTTTSGTTASGFANADLLLTGGGVTYTNAGGDVTVCSSVVYGTCTP